MVYQLAEQDADILSKFSVSTEGEVGLLTLTRALDFEEKSLYQVISKGIIIMTTIIIVILRLLSRLEIEQVREK